MMRSPGAARGKLLGLRLIVLVLCGAFFAVPSFGQVAGATMTGTLSDASGAQISINVFADQAGFYTAPDLLPGNYEVTSSAAGFATSVLTGVTLTVGAQQVLNIAMTVGQVAEKIEVKGEESDAQLASSTIKGVVNKAAIVDLPLNGRDWTQLATLQPGVISVQSVQAAPNGYDRAGRGYGAEFAISGSRPVFNNYCIDGVSVNDYANNGPSSVEGATSLTIALSRRLSIIPRFSMRTVRQLAVRAP